MYIRLHGFEHLRLEKHALQIQAFELILLHHLDDRGRKILTDVAQPAWHPGQRLNAAAAQAARAIGIVERGERLVDAHIIAGQRTGTGILRRLSQHQAPTAQAFGLFQQDLAHAFTPSSWRSNTSARSARVTSQSGELASAAAAAGRRACSPSWRRSGALKAANARRNKGSTRTRCTSPREQSQVSSVAHSC